MKIKLVRAICVSLAVISVTAGISYQVMNSNKKSEKLNAVFVMAYED